MVEVPAPAVPFVEEESSAAVGPRAEEVVRLRGRVDVAIPRIRGRSPGACIKEHHDPRLIGIAPNIDWAEDLDRSEHGV